MQFHCRRDAVRAHEPRLHFGVRHRPVLLVPHFDANRHARLVARAPAGRVRDHLPGRIRHQVSEDLLPERGVRLVGMIRPHLPAPASPGREQHRAAAAEILGDQQRQLALARRRRPQQHRGARLGFARPPGNSPSAASSSSVRAFRAGIVVQAADDALRALGSAPAPVKSRWNVPLRSGSLVGHQVGQRRARIAAVGERARPPRNSRPPPRRSTKSWISCCCVGVK